MLENKDKYGFKVASDDPIIFFGFVKHLEIIGEAVYKLTKEFRNEHPEVDWEIIENMRHVLVHGYYTIKPIQVWSTIENDLPELKIQIASFIEQMED